MNVIEGQANKEKQFSLIFCSLTFNNILNIIVMLILVGVSVTVALNGGLFTTANKAKEGTAAERDNELALSDGKVTINGEEYNSIDEYVNGSGNGAGGELTLPTGWEVTTKPETWTSTKVTAITDETNTIPLPQGFEISEVAGEQTVDGGLVITDGTNEFVWIPVADSASYVEDSFGHLTGTDTTSKYVYDSQEELNYYYGMQEDGTTPYYNYSDFTYEADKTNVENSIKTYGGFYVGRYETTIDGTTIGVQKGKAVLTTATLLKEGTNTTSNDEYHYRWWGLYKVQKDMYAQNEAVGSAMISSKQWDAIMTFTSYGSTKRPTDTYTTKPDLSGSAYATDSTQFDVSKNIYDLAGNVYEFTLKADYTVDRTFRGGIYDRSDLSASFSSGYRPYSSRSSIRF